MQMAIEATFAQQVRHVTILAQKLTRHSEVASKVQHRNNRGGHHFRIFQLTLFILNMMKSFQQIIIQAKYEYNLGIHVILRLVVGFSNRNCIMVRMDLFIFSPQNAQLDLRFLSCLKICTRFKVYANNFPLTFQ